MKLHYFDQVSADTDDIQLELAKRQGYVPQSCLLGGIVVMDEVNNGRSACAGCNCLRSKCQGRPKKEEKYGVI